MACVLQDYLRRQQGLRIGSETLAELLLQPVKQLAARGEPAAVEAERKLIEVVVQVVLRNGALMRSQQPSLQQCGLAVGNSKGQVQNLVIYEMSSV